MVFRKDVIKQNTWFKYRYNIFYLVKKLKNLKKTSVIWENPINFLNLDFKGNDGFNLDLCEVVC